MQDRLTVGVGVELDPPAGGRVLLPGLRRWQVDEQDQAPDEPGEFPRGLPVEPGQGDQHDGLALFE